jgi:hypothetical protein
MANPSGTYSIKIADKDPEAGSAGGSVLTVVVTTSSEDFADTVAGAIGHALDKLGVSMSASPSN